MNFLSDYIILVFESLGLRTSLIVLLILMLSTSEISLDIYTEGLYALGQASFASTSAFF